ncbi:MAG TPA: methyltransferase domain-containing protein [Xanthobacteraceae bacterium]|nr:methyltransferase domain-containing protein [Xanthobacteraceae bacterium]
MDHAQELRIIRRSYAKQIMARAMIDDPRIEAAFAEVRRENFLGPGPWSIIGWAGDYVLTPSCDPVYLYMDSVVGIRPDRNLNSGQPSGHAVWIASAAPNPGCHVVHVGAGTGYFTAILAHLIGRSGRLTAIEFDPELAACARANLSSIPNTQVIEGDGAAVSFDLADVIYVNAGATRPADMWLDRLAEGGRLILPLTTDGFPNAPYGAIFRIERRADVYHARWVSPVGIFPCEGARDPDSERALSAAFKRGGWERVQRLHRADDLTQERCWLRAPGWCLAFS